MRLFNTRPRPQEPRSPQAKYRDLLQQKQQLEQVVPTGKKQKEDLKTQIQRVEGFLSSYRGLLGLKTPK